MKWKVREVPHSSRFMRFIKTYWDLLGFIEIYFGIYSDMKDFLIPSGIVSAILGFDQTINPEKSQKFILRKIVGNPSGKYK